MTKKIQEINGVTYEALYNLMDKRTAEINKSMDELRRNFSDLEAGRLTRLEGTVATLVADSKAEDESPFGKLGYEIIRYIILAVIGAVLLLILRAGGTI